MPDEVIEWQRQLVSRVASGGRRRCGRGRKAVFLAEALRGWGRSRRSVEDRAVVRCRIRWCTAGKRGKVWS